MLPFTAVRARVVRGGKHWLLNRDFALIWSGLSVSTLGSYLTSMSLSTLAVLTLAATPSQMSLLVTLDALPSLALGLVAGVWIDRLPRRPLMLSMDIARAAMLLVIPICALVHLLSWGVLVAVAVAVGCGTVVFDLAQGAYLPAILPTEQLVVANSRIGASRALAESGGPALAGGIVQILTPVGATIGDALSYLFSAFCLGRVRHREAPTQPSSGTFWGEMAAGWRWLWGNAAVRALTLATVTRNFGGGAFAALYSLYLLRGLHLSPLSLGICISAGGVGALGGALLAPALTQRWRLGQLIRWTAVLSGCIALVTPLAGGALVLVPLVASQGCGDAALALFEIYGARVTAEAVPAEALGRVLGTARLLGQVALPAGALLAGLVSGYVGPRLTLGMGALLFILASLWLIRLPRGV
jgi:predicted MFS family arabinose efflux permease